MKIRRILDEILDFIMQFIRHRHLIIELTRRDFQKRYIKDYLGMAWAIIDPIAFITILYFVFGMRFGNKEVLGVPFIAYLIPAYISYNFFINVLAQATVSLQEFSFLINKVNFRMALIPVVKLFSNLLMHLIILVPACLFIIMSGVYPNLYWIQVFYYIICVMALLVGLSWMTSSIELFFPDISSIVGIVTRILFFMTPIFWNIKGLPVKIANILKLNPMFYVVNGYRDSFLYKIPFWEHSLLTLYFWGFTFFTVLIGILVFRRLRPHFADVA
jgi:ABC-type polysaccharide/polyol phosphate export permease